MVTRSIAPRSSPAVVGRNHECSCPRLEYWQSPNSGLRGPFGNSDRSHHKLVTPNTEYSVSLLGITDPEDEAIFEAFRLLAGPR